MVPSASLIRDRWLVNKQNNVPVQHGCHVALSYTPPSLAQDPKK